jgi:hypothetical protein
VKFYPVSRSQMKPNVRILKDGRVKVGQTLMRGVASVEVNYPRLPVIHDGKVAAYIDSGPGWVEVKLTIPIANLKMKATK